MQIDIVERIVIAGGGIKVGLKLDRAFLLLIFYCSLQKRTSSRTSSSGLSRLASITHLHGGFIVISICLCLLLTAGHITAELWTLSQVWRRLDARCAPRYLRGEEASQ